MFRPSLHLLVALAAGLLCFAPAARAADPMFTVSGIQVDARGYSASVAQSVAFAQGRPRAWQALYRRLTRQQDWDKQPQLNDTQLQRIVRNFSIANERRSTTRYTAVITYNFNPAAVAKILKEAKVAFTASTAHRILLVPMSPGYSRGAWTSAFIAPRFADTLVPFTLPPGDTGAALDHIAYDNATWLDVSDVALRVHATEAVLVLLQVDKIQRRLTLSLKRLGLGEQPMTSSTSVPYVQTAASTYPAAADAAVEAVTELWKQKAAIDYGEQGKLTADVRISSLAQWASIQSALATVPNVTSITVIAMDIGEARVSLGYLGTTEQLHESLSQASLQLSNTDPTDNTGEWVLKEGPPPASDSQPAAKPPPLRPSGSRT